MAAGTVFENITDATRALIQYEDARKHVSTFYERSALKILRRTGSIFIKGRSGSGKSNLGLRLLVQISSETERTPVVITSATQWNTIPMSGKGKYIVMLDDIFGSSSMVQTRVDEWLAKFNTMWPLIETGRIFIVLTSRPEIYDQCKKQLNTALLIRSTKCITLDKGEFKLRLNEKKRFLKMYCLKSGLTKEDFQEIVEKAEPPLGFPQCCHFFAISRQAQSNGKCFFLKPYEFIAQELDILEESDRLGYFVLLLVVMLNGRLESKELDSIRPSEDFRKAVYALKDIYKLPCMPSRINIRQKAESLSDVYLIHSNETFKFCHQSIFDVLFLKASQNDHSVCMKICPARLLVEHVRTQTQKQENISSISGILEIPFESFGILADRITAILLSEEDIGLLDHPSLRETCFVNFLFHKWCEDDVVSKLFKATFKQVLKAEVSNPCREGEMISLFECDSLLSCMALKGNTELVSLIIPVCEQYLNQPVLQQVLACAIFGCKRQLYDMLMAMGVHFNGDCFRAMCAIQRKDMNMTSHVVFTPDVQYFRMPDFTSLFTLALLNQNQQMEKLLLNPDPLHLPIFSACVKMLFHVLKELSYSQSSLFELNDNSDEAYTTVIEALLRTGCKIDPESLLLCGACHATATALRCLFKVYPLINVNTMLCEKTALQQALVFGGTECVSLLLNRGAEITVAEENSSKSSVLHMAAKSKRSSKQKLEMMFAKIVSDNKITTVHNKSHQVIQETATGRNCKEQMKSSSNSISERLVNQINLYKETPLHVAVAAGNADSAEFLIRAGARINDQGDFDMTPLHLAMMVGQSETIKHLIEADASWGIRDEFNALPLDIAFDSSMTSLKAIVSTLKTSFKDNRKLSGPLLIAVQNNELDKVKLLCGNGADVNSNFVDGTLLHHAVETSDIDMVKYLCEEGARVDAIDLDRNSVVHRAITSEIEPVEKLMYLLDERHAPVNIEEGSYKQTALFSAVLSGDDEIVELLIERQFNHMHTDGHGYSVLHVLCLQTNFSESVFKVLLTFDRQFLNIQSNQGSTALHILAANDNAYGMKMLLMRGADHSIQDVNGMTPLHVAAYWSDDCLQVLLHFKADPHIKDSKHRTVLHHAAKASSTSALEHLLTLKLDVNSADEDGWTPVHSAAEYGRTDNIKLLLDNGADVHSQDNQGRTALHVGCEELHSQAVDVLLQKMSNPNLLDKRMRSPLHLAARRGSSDNVKLLLDKGANPFEKDLKERTPLHRAVKTNDSQCVKLLITAKSDVCAVDKNGDSPLHLVTRRTPSSSYELLLENGASCSIQNKDGNTALHHAVLRGLNKYVKRLLENGSNPCVRNYKGQTPLNIVANKGKPECVRLLLQHGASTSPCDS